LGTANERGRTDHPCCGRAAKEIVMAEQQTLLQQWSAAVSSLVAQAAPSVVAVHSHRSRASGFIWRNGLIVTASESLAEDSEISVILPGGESVPAKLAGRDATTDIAVLRVEGAAAEPVPAVETVAAGSLALVVGAWEGEPTAAVGVVALAAGGWRSMRGGEITARIELDLSLRRASEGGLVLDSAGRAIGMAVFGPRRRVLVIPSATIETVAAKLESSGRIPRGYLGLGLQLVRVANTGVGAMVMSVDEAGPGAAAGVRQGDVIVALDGQPLRGVHALVRSLGPSSVGSTVRFGLQRGGDPVDVKLTIGERPEA
jgi:S1-C subfamily serine protease